MIANFPARSRTLALAALGIALCAIAVPRFSAAQSPPDEPPKDGNELPAFLPEPQGLVRLSPDARVWVDKERKLVVADARVAMREGVLEMFACPKRSKEHESIVAVEGEAFLVHAALLAVGAQPGKPVVFDPEYRPATGPVVEVTVLWRDKDGKEQKVRAQEWVRNVRTKKALEHPWVFAGSGFYIDPISGERRYLANSGDLICVSNFPSATLDLPIESSQANTNLLFEAFTERIPDRGTPVRLELAPQLNDKAAPQD